VTVDWWPENEGDGGKGTRRWQNEGDNGKRNVNLVVSSVLSPSEQAGVMSAMRNEIYFSLSNCPAFSYGK